MSTNSTEKSAEKDAAPFFVGYLPMPSLLKKFYWRLAVGLVVVCGLLGYWLAAQQKVAAPAIWNTAHTTTMHGLLSVRPYPVLHRFNPHHAQQIESILLVNPGKHSAIELTTDFAQQTVAIDGYEISRGDWSMLEIAGANSIAQTEQVPQQTAAALHALLEVKSLGPISLQGEIVDSKCFLGVMKPGAGNIHKACAEVCLLGGIPPMLIAKDSAQQKFGYLLTNADDSSASKRLAKFAAESVQVTGQLQQQGDLLFIALDENGVQRR